MTKQIVTGIAGSHRSSIKSEDFLTILDQCKDFDKLYETIYKMGGDKKICNSEAILLSGLYGAKEMGLSINHIMLKSLFKTNKTEEAQKIAVKKILKHTDGLLIASPVYFGDRSSLIAKLISLLKQTDGKRFVLDQKAAGMIAVGAKRNGGQETTNVFALFDFMNLGACVVGNGPPTSQYGGTAVAGAIGSIIDDTFGLSTSRGTGQRVGLMTKMINIDPSAFKNKIRTRILFLVTRKDMQNVFIDKIKSLNFSDHTDVEILDITDKNIKPCRACPVCPNGPTDEIYKCIIQPSSKNKSQDDMKFIYEKLINADAIVLGHYNGIGAGNDNYQVFMERTRFIRRNNFELTNKIFSAFYETSNTLDVFSLRGLSSFLRHNMFIVGPFYSAFRNKRNEVFENIDVDDYAKRLEILAQKARIGRDMGYNTTETAYIPIGYSQSA